MIDYLISSPFPLGSSQGNAISARRLETFLGELGYSVKAIEGYDGSGQARGLIALNAWRSAETVQRFRRANPRGRVVLQMTGTDLHGEEILVAGSPTRRALEAASRIAVFHRGALEVLPVEYHAKTRLTPCSIDVARLPIERWSLAACQNRAVHTGEFALVMSGNIRPVKAPEVLLSALDDLPSSSAIVGHFYGECRDPGVEQWKHQSGSATHRARWHGSVPWKDSALAMLESCGLVNSSRTEGAANAICEAMTLGVPVFASEITGNTGLLGASYSGLFPPGDSEALARMLRACEEDPARLEVLSKEVQERALLFTPEREKQGWRDLLGELEA